jgi:hypothetical protein
MDKLQPGLELDKLIAKKVLGWYQDSDIGGPRAWWFEKEKSDSIMGSGPYPKKEDALHLNYFSTDIKAAWDLAEMLQLCVVPWKDGWTAFQSGCVFSDGPINAAPTAPHAICLAALFYCREKEDGE